jgi:hypothetical protein
MAMGVDPHTRMMLELRRSGLRRQVIRRVLLFECNRWNGLGRAGFSASRVSRFGCRR